MRTNPPFSRTKKKKDGVHVWQLRVQVRSRLHRRRPAYTVFENDKIPERDEGLNGCRDMLFPRVER